MNGREKSLKWPSATLERDLKPLDRDHISTKSLLQNSDLLKLNKMGGGGGDKKQKPSSGETNTSFNDIKLA